VASLYLFVYLTKFLERILEIKTVNQRCFCRKQRFDPAKKNRSSEGAPACNLGRLNILVSNEGDEMKDLSGCSQEIALLGMQELNAD
jgi:hypothetical protein